MPTEELFPSRGLDHKAKSCIRCQWQWQKHLVVVGLQTESISEVEAMVVARIERKPERLGVGDRPVVIGGGRSSDKGNGNGKVIHC